MASMAMAKSGLGMARGRRRSADRWAPAVSDIGCGVRLSVKCRKGGKASVWAQLSGWVDPLGGPHKEGEGSGAGPAGVGHVIGGRELATRDWKGGGKGCRVGFGWATR